MTIAGRYATALMECFHAQCTHAKKTRHVKYLLLPISYNVMKIKVGMLTALAILLTDNSSNVNSLRREPLYNITKVGKELFIKVLRSGRDVYIFA